MTTLDTLETKEPLVEAKLKGRGGAAIGHSLAGQLGRPGEVARAIRLRCVGASFDIAGRVWALDSSQEM